MGKWIRIAVWYGFFIYGAVTGRWGIMAVSLLFAAVALKSFLTSFTILLS